MVERWRLVDEASVGFGYRVGGERFTEIVTLPVPIDLDGARPVTRLLDLAAVIVGVSYFKAFAPERVEYEGFALDAGAQRLVNRAYDEGLREYAFHNGFEIPFVTGFPPPAATPGATGTSAVPTARASVGREPRHVLVPFGGGKDSSLLAAALAAEVETTLFTVGHNPYVSRVADTLGLPMLFAHRTVDVRIVASTANGYLNGHVPVTGINSVISLILAQLLGADAVVMANERSASSDTVAGVNHQYSKSIEFERAVRDALAVDEPSYFSALRPWGDLAIARAFAVRPELLGSFMSCNRAFLRDPARRSDGWCGRCDKCRSVFLSLAPFSGPAALEAVFGRNLLDDDPGGVVAAGSGASGGGGAGGSAGGVSGTGAGGSGASGGEMDGGGVVDDWLRLVDAGNRPFDCVADVIEARQAFGLLAADSRWQHAAIVRAMTASGVTLDLDDEVFAAVGEHFVPPGLFATLSARHFTPGGAAPAGHASGDAASGGRTSGVSG